MQEWVDTLRLKLREMKILSPKENLYSKLPEIRGPLLPTRDPNSPLPATPPVPAAIVPGVERIVNTTQTSRLVAVTYSSVVATANPHASNSNSATNVTSISSAQSEQSIVSNSTTEQLAISERSHNQQPSNSRNSSDTDSSDNNEVLNSNTLAAPMSSTSNTLTSNLIKMLYPVTTYCHQANSVFSSDPVMSLNESNSSSQTINLENGQTSESIEQRLNEQTDENVSSLARTFANNVLAEPNTSLNSTKRNHNPPAASTSSKSDKVEGINYHIVIVAVGHFII